MSDQPQKFAPTAELVPVRAVLPARRAGEGAIIVRKDGAFIMLLRVGATNFDTKSPYEQAGIKYAFGSLVNGLDVDFPIQIVSHSRRLDVDAYTRQFEARLANSQTPPQIRRLIQSHITHFEQQVKQNNLLQREFYVAIPWKSLTGPLTKSFTDDIPLAPLFKSFMAAAEKKLVQENPSDSEIVTARQQLDLRAEQLQGRLAQAQLWSERMDEEQVVNLLFSLYHPGLAERQGVPQTWYDGRLMAGFSTAGAPTPQRRQPVIDDDDDLDAPRLY